MMVSDRNVFSFPGQSCSPERVREIEHNIGFELPPKYAELVQSGCCGLVHPDYAHIKGNSPETDDHLVKVLFGNGFGGPSQSYDFNLDSPDEALYIRDEWDIPNWGALIALGEGDGATPFLINYSNRCFPKHSVIFLDIESDIQELVATSFSDFWNLFQQN